ncbi:MAG: ABC transporter permease [Propionibacteriaceae bacterium]|jgi:putative ABC transport system permease protein|nr:ABC transporter permease [Propionibacteriaceae bacterium]
MFVVINALTSIARSKGRNILMGLVIMAVAAAACVALGIRHAAQQAEDDGLAQLTITGAIGLDRQAVMAQLGSAAPETGASGMGDSLRVALTQYPDLTLDQLLDYADSAHVADLRYSGSISLDTTGDVLPVSTDSATGAADQTETAWPEGSPGPRGGAGGGLGDFQVFNGRSLGDLTVTGYGSAEAMTEFISGSRRLVDGAMIDLTAADDTCLVTDEFAAFNGLATGDALTLANPADSDQTYTCDITGLYSDLDTSTTSGFGGGMLFNTAQDPANAVIVSYPTLQAVVTSSEDQATTTTDANGNTVSTALSPTIAGRFVFSSPADFDAFQQELTAAGLPDVYQLTSTDLNDYEASLVPLRDLSNFAATLLGIVLGVGAVIIVVLTIFNIRERKYEIGVLTAVGVAKPKVALQFVTEVGAVALIALIVGLGVGAAAAPTVADRLLSDQVAQQQAQQTAQEQNFGRPGESGFGGGIGGGAGNSDRWPSASQAVAYLDQINASLDLDVVSQVAAIGLGLIVVASAAGVVSALRYDPLTILANRS